MVFSSLIFLYAFLPGTLLLYFAVPKPGKNLVLLVASLIFYAWGEPRYLPLILVSILLGYGFGLAIEQFRGRRGARVFLVLSVVVSVGILACFKYADFLLETVNGLFRAKLPLWKLALPIGISFYTFQILSYTIDLYRGTAAVQRNLLDFATYVVLFPQLIAGPIVRYRDIALELRNRKHKIAAACVGAERFVLGLGKKVLLANNLGLLCQAYRATAEPSVLYAWLYAVSFTLQIYFDFSGYSDMAIGLGGILGFHFPENFRYPYIATSITEFWRRWHISLSSWFRDYVYIPLGGNRVSRPRWMWNILIVWSLTGLWHGAGWNFLAWGLLFALLLMGEKLLWKGALERHPWFGHFYVLVWVILSFVLFNAESFSQAAADLGALFGAGGLSLRSVEGLYMLRSNLILLLLAGLGATPLPKLLVQKVQATRVGARILSGIQPLVIVILLLLSTAYLVDGSFNPFLYFRF